MVMRLLLSCLTALCLAGMPGYSEVLSVESRVTSAVINPDGATLTRSFDLDLPAGEHVVEIVGLPEDVAISALFGAAQIDFGFDSVTLHSIGYGNSYETHPPIQKEAEVQAKAAMLNAESALRELVFRKKGYEAESEAAHARIDYLKSLNKPVGEGTDFGDTSSDALGTKVTAIGSSYLEALNAALGAERAIEEMADSIEIAEKELKRATAAHEEVKSVEPETAKLILSLSLKEPYAGTASLKYMTEDASWIMLYEMQLVQEGAKGMLHLSRRAMIENASGEEWNDIRVKLSTAEILKDTQIDDPSSWIGRLRDKPKTSSRSVSDSEVYRADSLSEPVMEPEVIVEDASSGFSQPYLAGQILEFDVRGPVSTRPDNQEMVLLDVQVIEVDLSAKIVPARWQSDAFLIARLTNSTGGPIVPGQAFIFRDGVRIGIGPVNEVGIGEEFEFSFGEYDGIEVSFDVIERLDGDVGIISSSNRRIERDRFTIRSHLGFDLPVRVLSRAPVSEDEDLVINVMSRPQPTEKDVDGKRGVVAWDFPLEAGATEIIDFGYEAQWPLDKVFE